MLFSTELQHYWPCIWINMKKFEKYGDFLLTMAGECMRLNCCKYSIFWKNIWIIFGRLKLTQNRSCFCVWKYFYHTWTDRDSIVWEFKVRNIGRFSHEIQHKLFLQLKKRSFCILKSLYEKKSRKCHQKKSLCSSKGSNIKKIIIWEIVIRAMKRSCNNVH